MYNAIPVLFTTRKTGYLKTAKAGKKKTVYYQLIKISKHVKPLKFKRNSVVQTEREKSIVLLAVYYTDEGQARAVE